MSIDGLPEEYDSLTVPKYAPRIAPTPIPVDGINEPPYTCVRINRSWVAHLLGVISALQQRDTWIGTDEQIDQVLLDLMEFKLHLISTCEENGGMTTGIQDIRLTECGLEVTYDGVEWVLKADLDDCANTVISSRLSTAFRSVGSQFQVDTDDDGMPDLTFNLDARTGDTTIVRDIPEVDTFDHIWTACYELVGFLTDSLDASLSKIDATASWAEAVQEILSAVPGFGALPFDEVFGFVETMAELGTATVRSFLTPQAQEQAACRMFCAIINTEALELNNDILQEWQSGEKSENSGRFSVAVTSEVIKVRENISRWRMYLDNPPQNDWETLCGCTGWCYRFDFTTDDHNWTPVSNEHVAGAVWSTGVGWEDTWYCGSDPQGTYLMVERGFSIRNISRLAFRWYQENLDYEQQWSFMQARLLDTNEDVIASLDFKPGVAGWNEEEFTTGWSDVARVQILIAQASCPARNGLVLQWAELEGEGFNPFGGNNCE